jgi:hypothetical protein
MTNDTQLSAPVGGGDVIQTIDQGAHKTPVTVMCDASGTHFAGVNSGALQTTQTPVASGGLSHSRFLTIASTNLGVAKAGMGQFYGYVISNDTANKLYLKLFDKAANPVLGTDSPFTTIVIPGNSNGATGAQEFVNGVALTNGLAYAVTGAIADADTTPVAANAANITLLWK